MIDKIKSIDRQALTLLVVGVLVVFGVIYANSNKSSEEESASTAVAQEEAADDSQMERTEEEAAEEEAPAEDSSMEQAEEPANEGSDGEAMEREEAAAEPEDGPYNYTAQSGDSYSKIARKAIQTYGIVNDVALSPAQIVYAETTLTQAVDSPLLEVGQNINIGEELLQTTVDDAVNLDQATEAQWSFYVKFVNFDTNAVGEATE